MEKYITSFDGTELFFKKCPVDNPKAAIVIVHGLAEHCGRYDYFSDKLNDAGFTTYRFDHRGHGQSKGDRGSLKDYNELLDDTNVVVDMAIEENPDIPVFLFGHSMGGFTVSLYGAKYPDKKLRGILTSGALTFDNGGIAKALPDDIDPNTDLPNELGDGVCSVKEVRDDYEKDPLNLKSYKASLFLAIKKGLTWYKDAVKDFAYPILISQGREDALVSYKDSIQFMNENSSKDCELKIYKGLCHEILNEYAKDEVIADMIRWMERRI